MSTRPTLLFLHGVGGGDRDARWREALDRSLQLSGYDDLSGVNVRAPKYAHALRGSDDTLKLPPLTVKTLSGDRGKSQRRAFEQRLGALEVRLGRHRRGSGWAGGDVVNQAALLAPQFAQAANYLTKAHVRSQVLHRVLKDVPSHGRLVIVAHSLGSVIAADLLRRLPTEVEIEGLVTIGSPLAHPRFHVDKLTSTLADPPANLGWWVNFWNPADPVTTHKGASSAFPWLLDYRIRSTAGLHVHDSVTYLSDDVVTSAIGYALFGSRSKALAVVDRGVDIPLDTAEQRALLALRYAHITSELLKGDKQDRYRAALRQVQAQTLDQIVQRNTSEGRPIPSAIARLEVDRSDPESEAPKPVVQYGMAREEALLPLLSIAGSNVLRPFEIAVPADSRREAMATLTLEMGLGSQIGTDVFTAAETARSELDGGTNWVKWAALGLGAAAVVAATGGLALAAAPGVAGAAAVTSALAAFGPGGMIGGLLTAGTLVSAGGGSLAIGLASPTTSAATVEAVVESQLAVAVLRRLQGFEQEPATWHGLVEIAEELRREHERLDEISDESSPTLKDLRLKIHALDRAIAYLEREGLDGRG